MAASIATPFSNTHLVQLLRWFAAVIADAWVRVGWQLDILWCAVFADGALSDLSAVLTLHMWLMVRPLHRSPLAQWKRLRLVLTTVLIVMLPLLLPAAHSLHIVVFGRLLIRGGKKADIVNVPLFWAAGMFALFSLHLHCPIVHPMHIALGHSSIMGVIWGLSLLKRIVRI
ncbi:MAG: hypothetical protein JXR76_13960 [Deltaproteobacteria bacterium]|nr:hypothetical protein [Deltaproteobacteria bacterium]